MIGTRRLQDAGEYACLHDRRDDRGDPQSRLRVKLAELIEVVPKIGRPAIRPLTAALQTDNPQLKAEIVRALGRIGYPQSLPYLKLIAETSESMELRSLAAESIRLIDPRAAGGVASALFYQLGERYYYHDESPGPADVRELSRTLFLRPDRSGLVRTASDQATSTCYVEAVLRVVPGGRRPVRHGDLPVAVLCSSRTIPPGSRCRNISAKTTATASVLRDDGRSRSISIISGPRVSTRVQRRRGLGAVSALATTPARSPDVQTLWTDAAAVLQVLSIQVRAVRYNRRDRHSSTPPQAGFRREPNLVQNLSRPWQNGSAGRVHRIRGRRMATFRLAVVKAMYNLANSRNPLNDLMQSLPALTAATKERSRVPCSGLPTPAIRKPHGPRANADMRWTPAMKSL
jgi:hypothetical protein